MPQFAARTTVFVDRTEALQFGVIVLSMAGSRNVATKFCSRFPTILFVVQNGIQMEVVPKDAEIFLGRTVVDCIGGQIHKLWAEHSLGYWNRRAVSQGEAKPITVLSRSWISRDSRDLGD